MLYIITFIITFILKTFHFLEETLCVLLKRKNLNLSKYIYSNPNFLFYLNRTNNCFRGNLRFQENVYSFIEKIFFSHCKKKYALV